MSYDTWLTKGSDYGLAEWEEWSASAMADEAYDDYRASTPPHCKPLSFEDWLNTEDAEDAFDAARYPAFEYPDLEDVYDDV